MKVTTDACLFGAWLAEQVKSGPGSYREKVKNVLDIGTGTGLLSLMYAQKNPDVSIDAIEIDKEAYEQAKENAAASLFSERIEVIHGDLKKYHPTKKYDLIISNPPFYEKEIRSVDEKKNIAHHYSGLLLEELLAVIKKSLNPQGKFYLLLPFKRNEEIRKIFLRQDLFISRIVFVKQTTTHNYFRLMIAGELKETEAETIIDEISIRDEQRQYTDEFKELLKDYYLHL
jgi:tRNA1Val (adenine37-N6)-methyltransferase